MRRDNQTRCSANIAHNYHSCAGSTELEWGIPEAGSIWADCLLRHLGVSRDGDRETGAAVNTELTSDLPAHGDMLIEETGGIVLMSIGGGHYVPKVNDVVTSFYYCIFCSFL
jgi:D-tyrosyl-tRNA(Tyr) deacylase